MESQQSSQRLGAFVNQSSYQFSVLHSDCTKRGALIQCWVPREDGQQRVLSTKVTLPRSTLHSLARAGSPQQRRYLDGAGVTTRIYVAIRGFASAVPCPCFTPTHAPISSKLLYVPGNRLVVASAQIDAQAWP